MQKPPLEDFFLKETKPRLGATKVTGDKHTSTYDLVEEMPHIYVRIVKAKDLPGNDATGSYVEIIFGEDKGRTWTLEEESNCEWNQVFAFPKYRSQSGLLVVTVRRKDDTNDELFIGELLFSIGTILRRIPPDGPPAPQWYWLEDERRNRVHGELMMAVWLGNQADEEFPEAWNADQAGVSETDALGYVRSNLYLSPKFWYLRVNVIEAKDLLPSNKGTFTEVSVKAVLGNQVLRTGFPRSPSNDFKLDQELMFVVAEPIMEPLILRVEDGVAPDTSELLGRCTIPLQDVERRQDNTPVNAKCYNLEKRVAVEAEQGKKEIKLAGRIYMRICLEGGYHVLDEPADYCSDLQPTAKQLRKTSIGLLELGILSAHILMPTEKKDGRGKPDAYCVAKYGQKWVRTRTIIGSFTPHWNEQCTWEVFDPCTVLTIGLFDDCLLNGRIRYRSAKDLSIGKVRIRLSTLESGRIHTHLHPLLVLNHNGMKKIGEIHLALRFTWSSFLRMMHTYSQPLLPKMHYLHPLTDKQLQCARRQAVQIISMRFSLVDQPLRKDVVEYMLDVGSPSDMWSMRRSKANFFRIMALLACLIAGGKWLNQICHWKSPITTILIHILFIMMVMYPGFILPAIFLYLFLLGIWNCRWRPRHPIYKDIRLSHADSVHSDELDEEFDNFPTCRHPTIVRMRYDRLRSIAGRIQTVLGDLATLGERILCLLTSQDRRATTLFLIFCVVAAIIFCIIPFRVVVLLTGFYFLRHPRFRRGRAHPTSMPWNFFKRLPDYRDICDIYMGGDDDLLAGGANMAFQLTHPVNDWFL